MTEEQKSEPRRRTRKMVVGKGGETLLHTLRGMLQVGEIRGETFENRVMDAAFDLARVGEEGISWEDWYKRVVQAENTAEQVIKRVRGEQK